MPTPNVIPGSSKGTGASQTEVVPEEGLYVPVINTNYIPEGVAVLEGFVPSTPQDDATLNRIKDALETQGHISGEEAQAANDELAPEEPPVEPPAEEPSNQPATESEPADRYAQYGVSS